jgi:hypothetical protein
LEFYDDTGGQPDRQSDPPADAISFFDRISKSKPDVDVASPLNWRYVLRFDPRIRYRINSVTALLKKRGFTSVETIQDSATQPSVLIVLTESRLHTVESFSDRVKELFELATWMGCEFAGMSVDNSV